MAFLKKSKNKLKGLSRKASNGAAIDKARAEMTAKAKTQLKKPLTDKLQNAEKKRVKTKAAPTAPATKANNSTSKATQGAKSSQISSVASNFKAYQAPEFHAKIENPEDYVDVTAREASSNTATENSFKDDRIKDDDFDVGLQAVIPRPARTDVNAMRLDVARISADIQSGEELYRRAQQRIENLTSFVERADVDFSLLNRLEPENRRLKARNRTVESELDDHQRKLSVLQMDLDDHRKRLEERNLNFDQAQSKLSVAKKSLQTYERTLQEVQQKLDKSDLAQERMQTALEVERRENEVLRERVTDMNAELDEKQNSFLEAKKMADSLVQDCQDFRQTSETAHKANVDLRNALDAAQKQNNTMKGEMITLHEDIRSFKTQYEFNLISREDEITAMQTQIVALKKQLEVKDEIVRNAARDVTELRKVRTSQDLERERLESQIESQNFHLDKMSAELAQSQHKVSDFDRRYRDVAAALSVTQARRTGNARSETPDIQPVSTYTHREDAELAPPLAAIPRAVMQPSNLTAGLASNLSANLDLTSAPDPQSDISDGNPSDDDLNDDDIINRITEFKLGLRKDLG